MSREEDKKKQEVGIPGLPRTWAVPVQLIGTFGLAVFLVIYYLLVMQPKEAARYDGLRTSVDQLTRIVEGRQSLLSREQADDLEALFIMAVAPEIADLIVERLEEGAAVVDLRKELEDLMILRTDLLRGLARQDGGVVSEMLTHKIRNSDIASEIAERAVDRWREVSPRDIRNQCRGALESAIRRLAMAK